MDGTGAVRFARLIHTARPQSWRTYGPRLRAQNQQLRTLLVDPDTSVAARLRAEAALGAIWRPLIADPPVDLTDPAQQHTLVDAAVAALPPKRPSADGGPMAAAQPIRTPSTRA